ncbi:hypothetical protein ABEB36_009627 [Hypothenemus hampei]|uniref:THAP-type domain-containing protein n=1 Tax=Hypothenemus hampei TaxID=57062 RepID=A0ABD1EH08_HYPHA
MSCSVKDCKSAKKFNEKGVRFHRFPPGDLLAHWKTTLNLDKNWTRTAQKFVCSKHFKVEDYLVIGKTTRLRPNAVPSVSICQSQLFPRKEDVLNTFATLIEFKDPKGDIVSWRFIEKLHKLQDEETIRLANKLKKTHLEQLSTENRLHKTRAQVFYDRKKSARLKAKSDSEYEAISMDYQKNVPLPNIPTNDRFSAPSVIISSITKSKLYLLCAISYIRFSYFR